MNHTQKAAVGPFFRQVTVVVHSLQLAQDLDFAPAPLPLQVALEGASAFSRVVSE